MRRCARDEGGSNAVAETTALAVLTIVAVATIAPFSIAPTEPVTAGARKGLDFVMEDVLELLDEMPPGSAAYASYLEELVTQAVIGNATPLDTEVKKRLPAGTRYELFLDNLRPDGLYPLVSRVGEEPEGEAVTRTRSVMPHWSFLMLRADVAQLAGVTSHHPVSGELLTSGSDYLMVRGVLVLNNYIDTRTTITLRQANAQRWSFERVDENLREIVPVTAEDRYLKLGQDMDGPGFDVPYRVDDNYATYSGDLADLGQAIRGYQVEHDMTIAQPIGELYEIHPRFTAAGQISHAMRSVTARSTFYASSDQSTPTNPIQVLPGATVNLHYDLPPFDSVAPSVVPHFRTIRIFNPAGVEVLRDEVHVDPRTDGGLAWTPKGAIWGTYVAELEVGLLQSSNPANIYLVRALTYFNVVPYASVDVGASNVPDLYAIVLRAWYPEWDAN